MLHWLWDNASTVACSAGFEKYDDYRRTLRDRDLMTRRVDGTRELLACARVVAWT